MPESNTCSPLAVSLVLGRRKNGLSDDSFSFLLTVLSMSSSFSVMDM